MVRIWTWKEQHAGQKLVPSCRPRFCWIYMSRLCVYRNTITVYCNTILLYQRLVVCNQTLNTVTRPWSDPNFFWPWILWELGIHLDISCIPWKDTGITTHFAPQVILIIPVHWLALTLSIYCLYFLGYQFPIVIIWVSTYVQAGNHCYAIHWRTLLLGFFLGANVVLHINSLQLILNFLLF